MAFECTTRLETTARSAPRRAGKPQEAPKDPQMSKVIGRPDGPCRTEPTSPLRPRPDVGTSARQRAARESRCGRRRGNRARRRAWAARPSNLPPPDSWPRPAPQPNAAGSPRPPGRYGCLSDLLIRTDAVAGRPSVAVPTHPRRAKPVRRCRRSAGCGSQLSRRRMWDAISAREQFISKALHAAGQTASIGPPQIRSAALQEDRDANHRIRASARRCRARRTRALVLRSHLTSQNRLSTPCSRNAALLGSAD